MNQVIPDDVLHAVRKTIRGWLLSRYVGGRRMLNHWNDHYASLSTIQSWSLPGDARSNLARLKKLAELGVIINLGKRISVYSFTLPRPVLDRIAAEETARYQRIGYMPGQIMPEINEEVAA
jgi:hypothetical protein